GITVGDNAWFGAGAKVLDGVKIGAHSIIGTGAVVTKDIPEYSIAVGLPAKVIRDRRTAKAT
ncbi:MAG: DapH/DapD/GlmU-related protein, partial [Kiritimatiellaeota bacterium]|nr:DapH/DapD/GlmU-related protein [Kiritimatiellota bacterium]